MYMPSARGHVIFLFYIIIVIIDGNFFLKRAKALTLIEIILVKHSSMDKASVAGEGSSAAEVILAYSPIPVTDVGRKVKCYI